MTSAFHRACEAVRAVENVDGLPSAEVAVLAVLRAIREPDEGIMGDLNLGGYDSRFEDLSDVAERGFTAYIDALLSEGGEGE